MNKQWEPYQNKFWTETWENSPYSIQELIDGDQWVGVKHSPLLQHVLSYVNKDSKILEAGCGLGQWVIYLSELGFNVTGLDFSESIIEKIRFLYPDKKFVVGDVTNFAFADSTFDAILSWGVVEHFIDGPSVALKEANRILTKNGILFITVPCKNIQSKVLEPIFIAKIFIMKIFRKLLGKVSIKTPFYQHNFKKSEFEKYLYNNGFVPLITIPFSHEVGFAKKINYLFKFSKRQLYIFNKNKGKKWQGLNPAGRIICLFLKKMSPWLTPDQIFIIAKKN